MLKQMLKRRNPLPFLRPHEEASVVLGETKKAPSRCPLTPREGPSSGKCAYESANFWILTFSYFSYFKNKLGLHLSVRVSSGIWIYFLKLIFLFFFVFITLYLKWVSTWSIFNFNLSECEFYYKNPLAFLSLPPVLVFMFKIRTYLQLTYKYG